MKVMVLGATTRLGAAIVEHLLARRDVDLVLAIGREPDRHPPGERVVYRSIDLTHARALHDLVHGEARERNIAVVVHAMQHRRAADRGARVHVQNVEAARKLVVECADHPTIRRLVYRSFAEVYAPLPATPDLIDEDAPLDFDPAAPQWLRDRVEGDLAVCAHFGGTLEIAVLRCAEIVAPGVGSQLWDYLSSRACLRPLGFDPMLNVLSLADAAEAFGAAATSAEIGAFNICGYDTLPLSRAIAESGRFDIAVPSPMMAPLYRLRRTFAGFDFHYDLNARRFHFGGVLDGRRARDKLRYVPKTAVSWPRPWWKRLIEQLAADRAPRGVV
jgi:UDP-glucose 4-epimerase